MCSNNEERLVQIENELAKVLFFASHEDQDRRIEAIEKSLMSTTSVSFHNKIDKTEIANLKKLVSQKLTARKLVSNIPLEIYEELKNYPELVNKFSTPLTVDDCNQRLCAAKKKHEDTKIKAKLKLSQLDLDDADSDDDVDDEKCALAFRPVREEFDDGSNASFDPSDIPHPIVVWSTILAWREGLDDMVNFLSRWTELKLMATARHIEDVEAEIRLQQVIQRTYEYFGMIYGFPRDEKQQYAAAKRNLKLLVLAEYELNRLEKRLEMENGILSQLGTM